MVLSHRWRVLFYFMKRDMSLLRILHSVIFYKLSHFSIYQTLYTYVCLENGPCDSLEKHSRTFCDKRQILSVYFYFFNKEIEMQSTKARASPGTRAQRAYTTPLFLRRGQRDPRNAHLHREKDLGARRRGL